MQEAGQPVNEAPAVPQSRPDPFGPDWYGEQDENGVDLSLIRENLRLTPLERVRRGDAARKQALKLLEYGRRYREKCSGAGD